MRPREVICKEKARVTFSEWFSLHELWWPGPVVPEKTVGQNGRIGSGEEEMIEAFPPSK